MADADIPRNPSWLVLDIEALNSERKQKVGDRFTKQAAHVMSPKIRNAAVENSRLQYYRHFQAEAALKIKSPVGKISIDYSEDPAKAAASKESVAKLRDAAALAAAKFSEKDAKDREKKLYLMMSALKGPSPGKSPRMQRSPDKESQSVPVSPRVPSSLQSSSKSPRASMIASGPHVQRNMNQELDAAASVELSRRRETSIRSKHVLLGPMERLVVVFTILRYGQVMNLALSAQILQHRLEKVRQKHGQKKVWGIVRKYVHRHFRNKFELSDNAHYALRYLLCRYRKRRQIERVKTWLLEFPKRIKRDLVSVVTDYLRYVRVIQRFARSHGEVRRARILMLKLYWEKIERRYRNHLAEQEKARVDHLKAEEFSKLLAMNNAKEAVRSSRADDSAKPKTVQERWSDRSGLVNMLCDRMEEVQSGFAVNKRYMDNCYPPEELARMRGQSLDGEELDSEAAAELTQTTAVEEAEGNCPTRSEIYVATYLDDNKGRYDGDLTAREYILADYTSYVTERVPSKERNLIILRTMLAKKIIHLENVATANQQSAGGMAAGEAVDAEVVNKFLGCDSYLPYVTALLLSPAEKWSARNQKHKVKGARVQGGAHGAVRKAGAEALARYRREVAKQRKHEQAMHYFFTMKDVVHTSDLKPRTHTGNLEKDAEIDMEQLHAPIVTAPLMLLKDTNLGKGWREIIYDAVQTQIIASKQQKMRAALISADKSK